MSTGLAWAIATSGAPVDSSAALFHEALPFRQELLREVRRLAYEVARNQPLATVHAMTSLPRYQRFIKNKRLSEAEAVHSESNAIVEDIVERATEMRADIVYDGALTNPQKAIAKLQAFKDAGYEIRVFGVTVDPATAIARVARRVVTKGRLNIPVEELLDSHEGFREGFPAYARIADSMKLYDSNGASVSLIASCDAQGGDAGPALQIHDAAAFERFRATADSDTPVWAT